MGKRKTKKVKKISGKEFIKLIEGRQVNLVTPGLLGDNDYLELVSGLFHLARSGVIRGITAEIVLSKKAGRD